jgi:hypothetical protein
MNSRKKCTGSELNVTSTMIWCIIFLPRIEILTKIINHTNKETDLKAPHPVIYGVMLNNLSQIFSDTQRAKMTGFLPVSGL